MQPSSLLLTLCVALAQLPSNIALWRHSISPARIAVNEKIKNNHPGKIQLAETLAGHNNEQETMDDIYKAIKKVVDDLPKNLVLVYNSSQAVKAGYLDDWEEAPHKVVNEFGKNLTAQRGYQQGQLTKQDENALYFLLLKLAAEYRDTFNADYKVKKEIHLVPIAKIESNASYVVGVMHKYNETLNAIGVLVVKPK
uniref:Uncharacterized protein n=1 Tax=Ditylenchus dipsaci TaxID=166011 RepID=A0A915DQW6_9BILA